MYVLWDRVCSFHCFLFNGGKELRCSHPDWILFFFRRNCVFACSFWMFLRWIVYMLPNTHRGIAIGHYKETYCNVSLICVLVVLQKSTSKITFFIIVNLHLEIVYCYDRQFLWSQKQEVFSMALTLPTSFCLVVQNHLLNKSRKVVIHRHSNGRIVTRVILVFTVFVS